MDATPIPDLAARRRILRRVVGQAYAIVVVLLLASLLITPADTPLWVRGVATAAVLVVGALLAEAFVRVAAQRYPTMHLPAASNIVGAITASLVGFTLALAVQALLGYPSAITWATVLEALISAPVWLVFVGTITAARWRYLSTRDALLHERVRIESTRDIEREALSRARSSVADSVRPALAQLREEIDSVLAGPRGEPMDSTITSLRHSATSLVRPLSHDLYARGDRNAPARTPLRFLVSIMRTQPFRPLLVSALYLATALPGNVELYGFAAALPALVIDVAFIVLLLGGANLLMGRAPRAHLLIYAGTLVVIHGIPLVLQLPGVVDTDPQFSGWASLFEIAVSLLLLLGTSSLGLLDANREMILAQLRSEVRDEQVAEIAEAAVLAQAARELGARLHGPVQSTVLASAAALEQAVTDADTERAHAVLAAAAAAIDAAFHESDEEAAEQGLLAALLEVVEPWREICPVELAIDHQLNGLTGESAEKVTMIVREAVANAFRHGEARHVHCAITDEESEILMRIIDDGIGPGTKNWGLGITTIDRLSGGHWTLVRDDDQTVLTVRVSVEEHSADVP